MLEGSESSPLLVSLECIWDKSPHCAFTDLIYWKEHLWCVFRESDKHLGGKNGVIRLIKSSNGIVWKSVALFEREGWDLRDPKLSITPNGQMMLLVGGSLFQQGERLFHHTLTAFSDDGAKWSTLQTILKEEWLWRITWHRGVGYGVAYYALDPYDVNSEWGTKLYQTYDGLEYELVTYFNISGRPSETTLRFFPNGGMVALMRREQLSWIGRSFPPYEDWLWSESNLSLEGPNFLILPHKRIWAAGRIRYSTPYVQIEKMVLANMHDKLLDIRLYLPSHGDACYPGMVFDGTYLYMSYYSSGKKGTHIYLAKVAL